MLKEYVYLSYKIIFKFRWPIGGFIILDELVPKVIYSKVDILIIEFITYPLSVSLVWAKPENEIFIFIEYWRR